MEKPLDNFVSGYSNTAIFRKIAFIGDSLSSGEFETVNEDGSHSYHDLYEYSWGQFLARKNGLTAYNFSRSGMTAKWYLESYADEKDLWNKEKACQAYVIALGVNDAGDWTDIELGEPSDVGKKGNDTFASALEYVDKHKQDRLRTTAEIYLSQNPTELQPRFDVIEIYAPEGTQTKHPEIHHMEDAFQ